MRVNISLTDSEGNAFPTTGWINVFSNDTTGRLTTGTKVYATLGDAIERCRPPAGCTRESAVHLNDYLGDETLSEATAKAKEVAIEVLDLRLGRLLGIKLHKVKPAKAKKPVKAKKASRITRR